MPHSLTLRLAARWTICLALSLACELALADPLIFCFEDVPQKPWTQADGTGLNFELFKRVEKLVGEQFVYVSKPWKRCQEEVKAGVLHGFFAGADSQERRLYSVFPTLDDGNADPASAMYEERYLVFLRQEGAGSWDGKILNAGKHEILVQRAYLVGTILREKGFAINESAKSAEEAMRLLASGAADVAVLQGSEAEDLVKLDPRFKELIKMSPTPLIVLPLYLAIGHATYQSNPQRIRNIWSAIRKVRSTPEYRKLVANSGGRVD
jgi:polar amino acid transport system substrate-binding protein